MEVTQNNANQGHTHHKFSKNEAIHTVKLHIQQTWNENYTLHKQAFKQIVWGLFIPLKNPSTACLLSHSQIQTGMTIIISAQP